MMLPSCSGNSTGTILVGWLGQKATVLDAAVGFTKSLMKNDSPVIIRLKPDMRPPPVVVSNSRPSSMKKREPTCVPALSRRPLPRPRPALLHLGPHGLLRLEHNLHVLRVGALHAVGEAVGRGDGRIDRRVFKRLLDSRERGLLGAQRQGRGRGRHQRRQRAKRTQPAGTCTIALSPPEMVLYQRTLHEGTRQAHRDAVSRAENSSFIQPVTPSGIGFARVAPPGYSPICTR